MTATVRQIDRPEPAPAKTPRVLILAEECNPEWPSLPIVGYKYAREIAKRAA